MGEQLKPCPFCGGIAVYCGEDGLAYHGDNSHRKYCTCARTDCMPLESIVPVAVWQQRPIEDALQAELSTARAEIEGLKTTLGDWEKYREAFLAEVTAMKEENEKLHSIIDEICNELDESESFWKIHEIINGDGE